ncbi:MAG: hypothetical protein LBH01_04605 [Verrucomicrobiales bacterium]|jgi:hypothetical protein|nr:hypothetical protein [Verrucomicrobiales bacterium]
MKRKSVLVLAACLSALPIRAENGPAQAPQDPSLGLPSLEQSGSKKTLPDSPSLPGNNNVILPDTPAPSRPQTVNTGTDKNKDWLVNGLLEAQKKQQEQQNQLKQKQQQESTALIQQEYERQQKIMMGINNPLDNTKAKLGLPTTGTNATNTSGTTASTFNLPNARLSVSGSNPNSTTPANLSGLPELSNQNRNLPNGNSFNQPYSDNYNQNGYNPAASYNNYNSLPNSNSSQLGNNNLPRNPANANSYQNPTATNNLIPQAPTAYSLDQQPALPITPYSNPLNTPAQNNPFTSAQAANLLKQMDNKQATDPNRPSMKDLNNSIPNPSDMRRF